MYTVIVGVAKSYVASHPIEIFPITPQDWHRIHPKFEMAFPVWRYRFFGCIRQKPPVDEDDVKFSLSHITLYRNVCAENKMETFIVI